MFKTMSSVNKLQNRASVQKCKHRTKCDASPNSVAHQSIRITMHASRATKRSTTSRNALLDLGILQNVLYYVGPGHRLFMAPVSKQWNETYIAVDSQQLTVYNESGRRCIITCDGQMTMYSSVFTSPSRVQLAHETGLDCNIRAYRRSAGRHADIATLAAAHDLGMEYKTITMADAAEGNKLAEVQYLHSEGCPWPAWLMERALKSGFVELVRWCYEHGCPWDAAIAPSCAAETLSGNVELMAWVLQQSDTRLLAEVMRDAAYEGHISMCKYLHQQQCPWNASSTWAAAEVGNVDLLRWLSDNGCPWGNRELWRSGLHSGSVDVLAYLQQQGLLTSAARLAEMLDWAGFCNDLAVAKWLREQDAEWPTEYRWQPWSDEVLQWAIAEGFTPPTN
jgi:hypothetical protein